MIEIVHTSLQASLGFRTSVLFSSKLAQILERSHDPKIDIQINLLVFVSTTTLNRYFYSILVPGSPTSPDHKTKRQSDPTPFGFKGT